MLRLPVAISSVIADREYKALEFSEKEEIYYRLIDYNRNFPNELNNILDDDQPDLVITNSHKILDKSTINKK